MTFHEDGALIQLDTGAAALPLTVDVNKDFGAGELRVEITQNGVTAEDMLSIADANGITVAGNTIALQFRCRRHQNPSPHSAAARMARRWC